MNAASYLVVDDHPLVSESVCQQILACTGQNAITATSLEQARKILSKQTMQFVVIDMSLPDGDGIDFFRELQSRDQETKGILLSGLLSDADIQRAIGSGFIAIVTKGEPLEVTSAAIRDTAKGERYFSPDVAPIVESLEGGDLFTPRMIEVLSMLKDGLSNKQIASKLDVSEATVSFHVAQIKTRLGARTNRQIISQAGKLGISLNSYTEDKAQ